LGIGGWYVIDHFDDVSERLLVVMKDVLLVYVPFSFVQYSNIFSDVDIAFIVDEKIWQFCKKERH